jgi:hypothetical protein
VNPKANLAADLRTRGCPVCNHVINTARDYFAHWQYALSSDKEAQRNFATELGFCPRHFWQLHNMSSAWGESVGLAALTEDISRQLAKTEGDETASFNVQELLRTQDSCRVCVMLKDAEAVYVKRLATFILMKEERSVTSVQEELVSATSRGCCRLCHSRFRNFS